MKRGFLILFSLVAASSLVRAESPKHLVLSAVPFTEVKVTDSFWTTGQETNRKISLPHVLQWCEETGRISNFDKAAKTAKGEFKGLFFNDSDVYKMLEGAANLLAVQPDAELDKRVDEIVAKIAAAQQPNGYLNTYFTVAEPEKRWTNLKDKHEMYCAGHLIEAAVAHHRATGKRTFLDVAMKLADHIDSVFGPTKRYGVCGHEEIELALVKLHQATGQQKYLDLAKFFIDTRGDQSKREIWGEGLQDHKPVRQQSEIVGHAVRAMYLGSGMADVAACTDDLELIDAMDRLWRNMTSRKMYITGGIGSQPKTESFGDAYELPNDSAYCETCASIGLAFWAHRLNLMHGDAQYVDVLERAVYNAILAGVGMDGTRFFYVNPLAADGTHHREPFFECACCPPNVLRFLPTLPGYVYATGQDGIFVNLYMAGTAAIAQGDNSIALKQETDYPWNGNVKLTVEPQKAAEFTMHLRIPGWCQGAKLSVNGKPIEPIDMSRGYAKVRRTWQAGDVIHLDLPMPIERIEAHPSVCADRCRVAIQRGPIVYCFEAIDNGGCVSDIVLPRDPKFTAEHRPELFGGTTIITGVGLDGCKITAVPYYAWDHRDPGEMLVWVRQSGKTIPCADDPAWKDKLYRPWDISQWVEDVSERPHRARQILQWLRRCRE